MVFCNIFIFIYINAKIREPVFGMCDYLNDRFANYCIDDVFLICYNQY